MRMKHVVIVATARWCARRAAWRSRTDAAPAANDRHAGAATLIAAHRRVLPAALLAVGLRGRCNPHAGLAIDAEYPRSSR